MELSNLRKCAIGWRVLFTSRYTIVIRYRRLLTPRFDFSTDRNMRERPRGSGREVVTACDTVVSPCGQSSYNPDEWGIGT